MRRKNKITGLLIFLILSVLLIGAVGASAKDGPCKDEDSYAYICTGSKVIGKTEWGADRHSKNYIYMSQNMKNMYESNEYETYTQDIPKGMSYNEKTNTLTLDNYTGTSIECSMMGDDFTILLKGENTIEMLYSWSDGYGGSITITGKGTLNIKGGSYFTEDELYGRCGIKIFGDGYGSKDVLKFTGDATVYIEGDGDYNFILAAVYDVATTPEKSGIVFEDVKAKGSRGLYWISEYEVKVERESKYGGKELFSLVKKGKKQYLCREESICGEDGEYSEYYIICTDEKKPKETERFSSREEVLAAGYVYVTEPAYSYCVFGKRCTISAKTDGADHKDDIIDKDNITYAIISEGSKKKSGTVYATGLYDSSEALEEVVIPKSIKVNGITYKVTGIYEYAFSEYDIKKLVIGENVKYIGTHALDGILNLEAIEIKTTKLKASNVKKDAFAGNSDSITVTVPKKKLSAYKKLLVSKGLSKKCTFTAK